MHFRRFGDFLRVDAPAKLNLFLEVVAKRPDGFHEIETLMVPISLFDTLRLRATTGPSIQLDCSWASGLAQPRDSSAEAALPSPEQNLVYRALTLLRQHANYRGGAEVVLTKRIPASAGLGGASSDSAAALLAANEAWELHLSRAELADLAASLGSDIPFFFYGQAAVCRGRGEQIEALPSFLRLHVVVAKPPIGLSTPEVYRRCHVTEDPLTSELLCRASERGDVSQLCGRMKNDLEQPARELTPWIERVESAFADCDFVGHQMSGSGSSYFGVCRSTRQARRLATLLRTRRSGELCKQRPATSLSRLNNR